jgi:hypothetical protein
VSFGTSIDREIMSSEPMKQEMKARRSIIKWSEPLAYVLLVAVFGFITTIVTNTRHENPVREDDMVSYTIENEYETLMNLVKESKEISL